MSTINVHLPNSLHEAALGLAEKEEISLDQLITLALAEKMSTLLTEDILVARAKRGDREKFRSVLAKVPDVEPDDQDRL
jgi:hypothetical protein